MSRKTRKRENRKKRMKLYLDAMSPESTRPKQSLHLPQNINPRPQTNFKAVKERRIKAFYRSWEWKRLSYEVKLERGRICECCGAKPPKIVVNTDHIKPIWHFWHLRLDKTNLQILCEDCNMGKGSHDQTDFRALNAMTEEAEQEPETEQERRLQLIRDQLRLN